MKKKTLTLKEAFNEGKTRLAVAGIGEAKSDAFLLLSHVTNVDVASYYLDPDKEMTEEETARYEEFLERRSQRIPLQHITKEQEFMGYSFFVSQDTLIPRQDTEILVLEALNKLQGGETVLDLCTGSGCIIISLSKLQSIEATGSDISLAALNIAEKNGNKLGVRVNFKKSNLFENITGRFDMIVSNPPYIKSQDIESLEKEVRLYDPRIALDGGADGLSFYKKVIPKAKSYLKQEGFLLLEIGADEAQDVKELLDIAGYHNIYVKKDLAGLDRVVCGQV